MTGLPSALGALLQSAHNMAEYITNRGMFRYLAFGADLCTTRRLPGEPLLESISRTLQTGAAATALHVLCLADLASLVVKRLAVDSCSSAMAAEVGQRAQVAAEGAAATLAEVENISHRYYACVHLDLALICPEAVWLLHISGDD